MSEQSLNIEFKGVEFDVSFEYTPGEKEVRYYPDGSGYPGCPETIEINSVEFEGIEWNDYLTEKAIDEITQFVWDYWEDY